LSHEIRTKGLSMNSLASSSSLKLVEESENKLDRALNRFYQRRLQLEEKVEIFNCGENIVYSLMFASFDVLI
jgi:hypothetical protein